MGWGVGGVEGRLLARTPITALLGVVFALNFNTIVWIKGRNALLALGIEVFLVSTLLQHKECVFDAIG